MNRRHVLMMFIGCAALSLMGFDARADKLDDVVDSLKTRYKQLLEHKRKGLIGETWQGLVEIVKEEDKSNEELAAFVKAENDDRKKLYAILAEQEDQTVEIIAKNNAVRNFEKAKKGEYLKGPDKKWKKKE